VPLQEFRLLRTPHYFQAITTYVDELLYQHPDSLKVGIDYVLNQLKPNTEAFEYFAVHFLRQFVQPKVMGMDAVFVHLVETYLETGAVKLTNVDQQNKLVQMAQKQKPLLMGKVAPNIALKDRQGKTFNLHDLESDYTMLVIWAYDCGHCKHSAPFWKSFHEKFKHKGVKFVALCHVTEGEIPACWKYVDEQGLNGWLNAYDPQLRYIKPYNVETTPQVYLMDRNKVIIGKQIVAEKMEEVVDQIIELRKKGKL
jgi:peroxiredoxin